MVMNFPDHAATAEVMRLRKQRSVLRKEVRRLNTKLQQMTEVWAQRGDPKFWRALETAKWDKAFRGKAMWALRQALGLTATEVSNDDVIAAAATALREKKGGA